MIEGRMQTRNWTGQDNIKRYTTEIVAENLQMGPRSANTSYSSDNAVSDIKAPASAPRQQVEADEIPIIDENEPLHAGVSIEEDEVPINEKDLPF